MADEIAFARKASGLVRGLSMWDAFLVGFMNQGLMPSLWAALALGLSLYPGGNIVVAALLSLALAGTTFPIVWGILGGSMPRSGGEYIFNSRILHPLVGIAESFGNAAVWLFWIYILAPWAANPGLVMLGDFVGWTSVSEFAQSSWGMFAVGSGVTVAAFFTMVFGIKVMARVQRIVVAIGMAGVVAMLAVISLSSKSEFIAKWDALAQKSDSLSYGEFVPAVSAAAGMVFPSSWSWTHTLGLMVAGSWLFAYAYTVTYVSGEVKRPDRSIMMGNLFAILVPAFFLIWTGLAVYHVADFDFISASQWVDYNYGVEGYTMPYTPSILGYAYLLCSESWLALLMSASYVAFCFWWVVLSFLAFPRILFAWGMDRMGPKWFTDINPRFASPVKNYILAFVIAEVLEAVYCFWTGDTMQAFTVTGLEFVSVFGTTAVAALLFPYRGRAKGIWESSPYRTWKLGGIPVVTVAAAVNLIYLGILFYFLIVRPEMRSVSPTTLVGYIVLWSAGILWYFFWRSRNRGQGVDVSVTYKELPPE